MSSLSPGRRMSLRRWQSALLHGSVARAHGSVASAARPGESLARVSAVGLSLSAVLAALVLVLTVAAAGLALLAQPAVAQPAAVSDWPEPGEAWDLGSTNAEIRVGGGSNLYSSPFSGPMHLLPEHGPVPYQRFFAFVDAGGSLEVRMLALPWYLGAAQGVATIRVTSPEGQVLYARQPFEGRAGNWLGEDAIREVVMGVDEPLTSDIAGVWTVDMFNADTTYSAATALRWDIVPRDADGRPYWGRVWTYEYRRTYFGIEHSLDAGDAGAVIIMDGPGSPRSRASWFQAAWLLSPEGLLVRVAEGGYNSGFHSSLWASSRGLVDQDCQPLRASRPMRGDWPGAAVNDIHRCGLPLYRVFFEMPDVTMPASAQWFDDAIGQILVDHPVFNPVLSEPGGRLVDWHPSSIGLALPQLGDLAFTQTGTGEHHEGYVSVELLGQPSSVRVEVTVDGGARDVVLVEEWAMQPGTQQFSWGGRDGLGALVSLEDHIVVEVSVVSSMETHIVASDVPRRLGGIQMIAINGPLAGAADARNVVNWDDSDFADHYFARSDPGRGCWDANRDRVDFCRVEDSFPMSWAGSHVDSLRMIAHGWGGVPTDYAANFDASWGSGNDMVTWQGVDSFHPALEPLVRVIKVPGWTFGGSEIAVEADSGTERWSDTETNLETASLAPGEAWDWGSTNAAVNGRPFSGQMRLGQRGTNRFPYQRFYTFVDAGGSLEARMLAQAWSVGAAEGVATIRVTSPEGQVFYAEQPFEGRTGSVYGRDAAIEVVIGVDESLTSDIAGVWTVDMFNELHRPGANAVASRWDIVPRDADGTVHQGRVWTYTYYRSDLGIHLNDYAGDAVTVFGGENYGRDTSLFSAWDQSAWLWSPHGLLLRVDDMDYNGMFSNLLATSHGLVNPGFCQPLRESRTMTGRTPGTALPEAQRCGAPLYRVFFEHPDLTMPASAQFFNDATGQVVADHPVTFDLTLPSIDSISFTQTGHGFTFDGLIQVTLSGQPTTVRVEIDTDGDGNFDGAGDMVLLEEWTLHPGTTSWPWHGMDAHGLPVSLDQTIGIRVTMLSSFETHIVANDVERRLGGIRLTALNGPLAASEETRYLVNWDDSHIASSASTSSDRLCQGRVGRSQGPNLVDCRPADVFPEYVVGIQVDSRDGVHRWGGIPEPGHDNMDASWGAGRDMVTWQVAELTDEPVTVFITGTDI